MRKLGPKPEQSSGAERFHTMPRSTWSGAITFGMLSIPVKLYSATTDKDLAFNNLHKGCGSRLNQQMVCKAHGDEPVVLDMKFDAERAYEWSKDQYVLVTDADLAALPVPSKQTIAVDAFVDPAEIDPIYAEKAYWLEPEAAGAKPYALLAAALGKAEVLGVATITLRNKERLCTLRVLDDVLVLETMFWPDEVRDLASGRDLASVAIADDELDLAVAVVESKRETFDASKYSDGYRTALLDLIERKRSDPNATPDETPETARPSTNLMDSLRATLEQVRAAKAAEAA